MDIIFNCRHCDQELSVDASATGTELDCPSCGGKLIIPPPPHGEHHQVNPIATSAAAKIERHFSVPVHDKPTESLIEKPLQPLDAAAKDGDKKLRVKVIRHSDCVEVGKDHFDEVVTNFINKVGEPNIVKIDTFNYSHRDLETREWVTDYGAFILYRG